jgi:hypothetical protein
VQTMTTRDNRQIQKQTVRLLDFTANAVPIDIWDSDLIKRVEFWKPRETGEATIARICSRPAEQNLYDGVN